MKFIRLYEEFDTSGSIKDDIRDILIDLEDDGFEVRISDFGTITIRKSKPFLDGVRLIPFKVDSTIIDSILRLIKYCDINKLYLISFKFSIPPSHKSAFGGNDSASNITEKGIFGGNGKIVDYDINSIRIEISNKWYK